MRSGLLVIAFGNDLRGDDGVAHHVARRLLRTSAFAGAVHCVHQLTPDLAETIAGAERVCFVDAREPDGAADVMMLQIAVDVRSPSLGHAVSPGTLLALCDALYGRAPQAWLVTLPTQNFDYGEELSPVARKGVEDAVAAIIRLSEEHDQTTGQSCTS